MKTSCTATSFRCETLDIDPEPCTYPFQALKHFHHQTRTLHPDRWVCHGQSWARRPGRASCSKRILRLICELEGTCEALWCVVGQVRLSVNLIHSRKLASTSVEPETGHLSQHAHCCGHQCRVEGREQGGSASSMTAFTTHRQGKGSERSLLCVRLTRSLASCPLYFIFV
jgi:hypothetical protein